VQSVLQEEKFAPIVCHEYYQTTMQKQMPLWLAQISPFTNFLSGLGEEQVVLLVSNGLNTMTNALAAEKDGQGHGQMWNPLHLLMGGFQPRGDSGEAIHRGVECDGCKVSPIRGIRYKCTVCKNFDLCSTCEAAKIHDSNHPLLKMTVGDGSGSCMMGSGRGMHGWTHPCGGRASQGHFGHHQRGRQGGNQQKGPKAECTQDKSGDPVYGVAGSLSEKTWEVKNVGNEEWGEGVELVFARGHETLALAKRYPVPNLKSQESTQISAVIQIPTTAGRYSACFRLEKNGKRFGQKLWVDVFALAGSETENKENKVVETKPVVKCVCGAPMDETSPIVAYYESAEVHCDLCGNFCPINSSIYHCSEETEIHSHGYDLCSSCACSQIESFDQPQQEVSEEEVPKQEVSEVQVPEQPKDQSSQQPKQEQKEEPIQPKEDETNLLINDDPLSELINDDPLSGFQYQQEARDIIAMGFDNLELVKALLIKYKGNLDTVLSELCPQ